MASKGNALTRSRKQKGDAASIAGRLDEAKTLFESVCRADPLDVEAWVKLSLVHKRLGNHSTAEEVARRALKLQPNLGFAHYALANALHCQGRLDEAINSYRQAVRQSPDFADSHYLLGNALFQSGKVSEAIDELHRAIELRHDFPEALNDMGAALIDRGDLDEAKTILERVLALQPGNVIAMTNLGLLYRQQGKVDVALDMLRHAQVLAPDSEVVAASLAEVMEKTGDVEAAGKIANQVLLNRPDDVLANMVAARLERREKRLTEAANRLERLTERRLTPDQEAECRLLLGQIQDEAGNPELAFPNIVEGKRLKALVALRDEAARSQYRESIRTLADLATPDLPNCTPIDCQEGEPSAPVFLVGFPRSGTTLLEQILDSHPSIQTMEEQGAVSAVRIEMERMTAGRPDPLLSLTTEEVRRLRAVYFAEVDKHVVRETGAVFIDKLPLNIVLAPIIWRLFPEAKFILALRHPCDVCLSCLMQNFSTNESMSSFFTLDDTAATYVAVMSAWEKYSKMLPLSVHRLRYEDLVADVAGQAANLLAFLGLPWDDAVLAHTAHARNKGAINTPSYHQVTQPIYQTAKYRWHRYREALAPIMDDLQPFIERYGYGDMGRTVET